MRNYVVTYIVCGTHYRFRCSATGKRTAKAMCKNAMGVSEKDIVEVEEERL